MEDIAHVTDAMLRRVKVDLATDEIGVAFEAFNLLSWTANAHARDFINHFRVLGQALGVEQDNAVAVSMCKAAKVLGPLMKSAQVRKLSVDNRAAWSWALYPSWRSRHIPKVEWTADCDLLVAFYLSIKLNTTSVERDLSKLLAHLTAHSGPLSSTSGIMSSIMEINVEGPQQESDFFLAADKPGGLLKPTEFGTLCAKLWVRHFGRRFRYAYKVADPKQKQQKKREGNAPGSFAAAVSFRRKASTQALASARSGRQQRSFVPHLKLPLHRPPALTGTRWQTGDSQAAAALANFNIHSDRKRKSSSS